jgi:hypothetical protein
MDGRSPERSLGKFSPRVYAKYPELDQVLLHYLGIEELIDRHTVNPELFESQSSLNFLTQRFILAPASTFRAFLLQYDRKYATVRSYFLPGALPKEILLKAAEAGNLQAFYTGIKLYPKYRNPKFLNQALSSAALGGHQVMIELVKDLGGHDVMSELIGTVAGGHLANLKSMLSKMEGPEPVYSRLTKVAVVKGQLDTLKYLTSLWAPTLAEWNKLFTHAGASGNQEVIDYLVSRGPDNYTKLIQGAIGYNHIDLANKYLDKPGLNYSDIFRSAYYGHKLDLAKFIAAGRTIDQDVLDECLKYHDQTPEAIEYLISLGASNYTGLVASFAGGNDLELFKQYYKEPGIDYEYVFSFALKYGNLEVASYMIEKNLIDLGRKDLNNYLRAIRVVNLKLFELLFRLGATDYNSVVKVGLSTDNLTLVKKYFDRSSLEVNRAFIKASSLKIYKYLLSKGTITQDTLDLALRIQRRSGPSIETAYLMSIGGNWR